MSVGLGFKCYILSSFRTARYFKSRQSIYMKHFIKHILLFISIKMPYVNNLRHSLVIHDMTHLGLMVDFAVKHCSYVSAGNIVSAGPCGRHIE